MNIKNAFFVAIREVGLFIVFGSIGLVGVPLLFWSLVLFAGWEGMTPQLPERLTYVGAIFVASGIVLRTGLWLLRRRRAQQPTVYHGRVESEAHLEAVVVGLRRRATRLRRASYVTLGLIVLSVLLGFRAFAYAGYITQREERYQEFEFTRNLDSLSSELSSLIREAIKEGRVAEVSNQLEELKQTITDQAKTVRESRQMPSGMSVWSTISTRITSVLLLLFLVQILVTMYRYNTRLAAFYDARADILQLSPPQDAVAFTEVVTAFSADSLYFGRAPKTPAQAAVELAKELIKGGAVTRTQKVV